LIVAIDIWRGDAPTTEIPALLSWFSLMQLEFVMLLLGAAVLCLLMCRERIYARALAEAGTDALTGVASRGTFLARAERILARAAEEAASVSAVLFDLDHFKSINDTYGHAAGDRVLRAFAATAAPLLRPVDLIGRIGGEEFCVLLSGTTADAAYVIAERIRHAFETNPMLGAADAAISATVSAGVATNDQTLTLEALLEAADRALYRAKRRGRNRVERADDEWPPASPVEAGRIGSMTAPPARRIARSS